MSLFTCESELFERSRQVCIYAGVSPCRDQVSDFICNAHAKFHGLVYKRAHYTNGDNDTWSKINTYVCSVGNLNVPLFKHRGIVMLSEIHNFAMNVCQMYPGVRRDLLADKISCLLGINATSETCKIGGWLDSPTSALTKRTAENTLKFYNTIPRLHKILFYYTEPSTVAKPGTSDDNILLVRAPNVELVYQANTNSYSFIVPEKKILLKYTNNDASIATPIVLSGRQWLNDDTGDRVFRTMRYRHGIC